MLGLAVLPDILPNVWSQYFYRLEVAVRTSRVLGFIGAVEVLIIMLLILLIDTIGGFVCKRVI